VNKGVNKGVFMGAEFNTVMQYLVCVHNGLFYAHNWIWDRFMKLANSLPTVFATTIAVSTKLLPARQDRKNHEEYEDQKDMLAAFQQLAIVGELEEAMLAYHGQKLTKPQKDALELIYKTTKPWLYGHISGELLNQLSSKFLSGKDKKDVTAMILQCMEGQHGSGDGGGMDNEQMAGLLVRLTPEKK